MSMLSILLQEQAATSTNGWMSLGMMLLIFVVFYFFLIRPQSKRQKEIRKFQDSLENGRRVITSGGIYGKIKEVKGDVVVLEVADNVRIKVSKSMVFDSPENAQQQTAQPETKKEEKQQTNGVGRIFTGICLSLIILRCRRKYALPLSKLPMFFSPRTW